MLSPVRCGGLVALSIRALMARNLMVDWQAVSKVIDGCANRAVEDNRHVVRMAVPEATDCKIERVQWSLADG